MPSFCYNSRMEITEKTTLPDDSDALQNEGWARHPYWEQTGKKTRKKLNLKGWESYSVSDPVLGIILSITFSDMGYAGLFSITFADIRKNEVAEVSGTKLLAGHRTGSDLLSDSAVTFSDEKMTVAFVRKGPRHHILITAPYLQLPGGKTGLKADMTLTEDDGMESMNTASCWSENRTRWICGRKLLPLRSEGILFINHAPVKLTSGKCLGTLIRGMGNWTHRTSGQFIMLTGIRNEIPWGICLEKGFIPDEKNQGNAVIYGNKVHKLGSIIVDRIDESLWTISDDDGRLSLKFRVSSVLKSDMRIHRVASSRTARAFGLFSGSFILDNGNEIKFEDAYGFAGEISGK